MVVIYGLTNKNTLKSYVGCTAFQPNKRFREHRSLLRKGKHSEPELQADWSAHGEDAFEMQILETLPHNTSTAIKRERELKWMSILDGEGRLYNRNRHSFQLSPEAMAKGAANAHNSRGNRWTPEANAKRSLAQKGKPKGHGTKISATKKALGQRPSLEAARLGGLTVHANRLARQNDEIV